MPAMNSTTELTVTRHIRAPRSVVYAAWTSPDLIRRWFIPGAEAPQIEADIRVGGSYCISFVGQGCDGKPGMAVKGKYTELTPTSRVQFTWHPEDGSNESLVTVELKDAGDGTELRLTHTGLMDAADVQRHTHGWTSILDKLAANYGQVVEIAAAPEKVYAALNTLAGLRGWWTEVSGDTAPGGEIVFTFGGKGATRMRIETSEAPHGGKARVHWRCTGSEAIDDWKGTRVEFELASAGNGTHLRFEHIGLTPALPCFENCQKGWGKYLPSLKALAETGTGYPYPGRQPA